MLGDRGVGVMDFNVAVSTDGGKITPSVCASLVERQYMMNLKNVLRVLLLTE